MKTPDRPESGGSRHRLGPAQLRWRCDPARFAFETTQDLGECPINIIGQPRAEGALQLGLDVRAAGYNIFVSGEVGSGRSTVVRRLLARLEPGEPPPDLVYVHNFDAPDEPRLVRFQPGCGRKFREALQDLLLTLARDLPRLFDSDSYRRRRTAVIDAAESAHKAAIKDFEKRVQAHGLTLVQAQMGPMIRPLLVPMVAGNPIDMDQLEALVEKDQFKREDFEALRKSEAELRVELEQLSKQLRLRAHEVRRSLESLDRELARPLVVEAVEDVREAFPGDDVAAHLDRLVDDLVANTAAIRDGDEGQEGATSTTSTSSWVDEPRYQVNIVVDNGQLRARPVIWETAPNYRNLFGTIDRLRGDEGQWTTDHTRIKAGSLLRANGGILVLDAFDVLVEPGVWATLKRTLRHRISEIVSFDPMFAFVGTSVKPEPVAIDVKVVFIGTRHIYGVLHALDEDFSKIFKIKADFAVETPLNDQELMNYACLIHRRCTEESLPPFHRDAVATVVEQGARMAESPEHLTTRFTEIVDVVREAGFWAKRDAAPHVRAEHVDRALRERIHRVDLIEEWLRRRIADGAVLLDVMGEKVGQINGLAVLDQGDHRFALPSRITTTTAMGRAGIIDIDRHSELSGSIHTKGVLILTGFLRQRFAQDKPLTLTASLCFEQNYGGVEGDSASSAELYALLSSLAGVPLRQGVAVTGSVNQRGEIQPIGAVNEKIEGFFDLCNLLGLTGEQGVMIPSRNQDQLMLRKDVVAAVEAGRFHVWAVCRVEDGLEVLTGQPAGERDEAGRFPPSSIFGRVDTRLQRLAEGVTRFGTADLSQPG